MAVNRRGAGDKRRATGRGTFSSEYALMVVLIAAASYGMFSYMSHALAGRWRGVGDAFGHGRQYEGGPCGSEGVMCWAVTIDAKYGGDRWSESDPCGGNPCDPQKHCWASEVHPDEIEDQQSASCFWAPFTGYGLSQAEAEQNARAGIQALCPNHNGPCPEACYWRGNVLDGLGRVLGPTGYLCMRVKSFKQVCRSSCP